MQVCCHIVKGLILIFVLWTLSLMRLRRENSWMPLSNLLVVGH